jgi:tripartite-type tricarboxylate transporter receptor subunit TctC
MIRLLSAVFFAIVCSAAVAQDDFPSKPVRLIVPFPAGGGTDIISRAIGAKIVEEWKQPLIIDNRPGAGANIGAELAVKAPPDGYTLLMASTIHSINPSLYPKLAYDPVRDFTTITLVAENGQVLLVHPSVPVSTLQEFIAYVKARPGQLYYSSAGNGSLPHLTAEIFKSVTGTHIVHVPYKGAPPAMADLLGGQVQVSFASAPSAVPNVKSGKLKALGVSTLGRMPALPDVPTLSEAGLGGFEASNFFGLVGPPGIPPAIVQRINAAFVRVIKDPAIGKYLREQGAEAVTSTPAEYSAKLREEVAKWAKVVKESGARID